MSDFEASSCTADSSSAAVQKFHEDGFCVLPQCFDVNLVQKAHTKAEAYFDEVLGYIAEHQLEFGIGIKHGFKEIVQRHPLRYEMPYKMDDTFFDFVLQHQQLMSTVKTILQSEEVVIANRSCVMSLSGAECQAWHSDGPHVSVTEYLTCHVLNVFVPLVPITVDNGPTEFRPGSQKYSNNLAKGMLLAKIKKQIKPIEAPLLQLGDVLMVSRNRLFSFE